MRIPAAPDGRRVIVYDVETFPNYFLGCFLVDGKWHDVEGPQDVADFVDAHRSCVFAGFNSFEFDDVVLRFVLTNDRSTPLDVYRRAQRLIADAPEDKQANLRAKYTRDAMWAYSIDLYQLLNAKGSLKEWQCKTGFRSVVDSPADFSKDLPASLRPKVRRYCRNDVESTATILSKKWHLVTLRAELDKRFDLGPSVYVKTEAKLAQHVFVTLHTKRTGDTKTSLTEAARRNTDNKRPRFAMTELVSPRIRFQTVTMRTMLAGLMRGAVSGAGMKWSITSPEFDVDVPFRFGGKLYQLGVGGLHSVDGPAIYEETKETAIVDLDVTSYYPAIIINERLFPKQVGEDFVRDMVTLRDQRVAAKKAGDKNTADALKIVVNSTFGKLNDAWSPIRSTPDAHRVTVNGQLMLLMLIESLHLCGATVVSANTDGVTIEWHRKEIDEKLSGIIKRWERDTGMQLERADYRKIVRRDVNSYLAIYVDGKIKRKGEFNFADDSTKCEATVVGSAVEAYFVSGTPINVSVMKAVRAGDVRPFLYYQRVKNGGTIYHGETDVGKTFRWYVSKKGQVVRRKNPRGNPWATLPNGHSAQDARDISDLPVPRDLDAAHYIAAARDVIASVEVNL